MSVPNAFLQDLLDCLDGAASPAQETAVARAGREDARLRAQALEYGLQESLLEELFEPAPRLADAGELIRLARTVPATKARRAVAARRTPLLHGLPLAAAAALFLATGLWYFHRAPAPAKPQDLVATKDESAEKKQQLPAPLPPPPAQVLDPIASIAGEGCARQGNTLRTEPKAHVAVKLADGSSVTLKGGTTATFAPPSDATRQEVSVKEGYLYFEVAKDPRAFKVRAEGAASELQVVGTRFVFHVPPAQALAPGQAPLARVEVQEGVVRVKNALGERSQEHGGSLILCDLFAPAALFEGVEKAGVRGMSGAAECLVLLKNPEALAVRITKFDPDRENSMHQPEQAVGKVFWVSPPKNNNHSARERALALLREAQVMGAVRLTVWAGKDVVSFTAPER